VNTTPATYLVVAVGPGLCVAAAEPGESSSSGKSVVAISTPAEFRKGFRRNRTGGQTRIFSRFLIQRFIT
jgi:hypothetical protein